MWAGSCYEGYRRGGVRRGTVLGGCGGSAGSGGRAIPAFGVWATWTRAPSDSGKLSPPRTAAKSSALRIEQSGNRGILASSQDTSTPGVFKVSVETFNQNNRRIVNSFARSTNKRDSYGVDGIFSGDAALVTHYIVPKGSIFAIRKYETVVPVEAAKFTGTWTPPIKDIDVLQTADNQTTNKSVAYAIELKNQDRPDLIVSNVAADSFGKPIHLDPNVFSLGNGPQLAQYTSANLAVLALSPDGGAVGG